MCFKYVTGFIYCKNYLLFMWKLDYLCFVFYLVFFFGGFVDREVWKSCFRDVWKSLGVCWIGRDKFCSLKNIYVYIRVYVCGVFVVLLSFLWV